MSDHQSNSNEPMGVTSTLSPKFAHESQDYEHDPIAAFSSKLLAIWQYTIQYFWYDC
jgi:hypothetical protein